MRDKIKTSRPMPSSVSFYNSEFLKVCHPSKAYSGRMVDNTKLNSTPPRSTTGVFCEDTRINLHLCIPFMPRFTCMYRTSLHKFCKFIRSYHTQFQILLPLVVGLPRRRRTTRSPSFRIGADIPAGFIGVPETDVKHACVGG